MAIETEMFRLLFLCHERVNLMELSMREKELLIMFGSERRLDTHKRLQNAIPYMTDSLYKVNIIISAGDRPGMMADIMMVMSESKLNINALNCRIDKHKMANISMGIDISNLEQLDNIMNKIKRMKGVYSVERMISNGQGG